MTSPNARPHAGQVLIPEFESCFSALSELKISEAISGQDSDAQDSDAQNGSREQFQSADESSLVYVESPSSPAQDGQLGSECTSSTSQHMIRKPPDSPSIMEDRRMSEDAETAENLQPVVDEPPAISSTKLSKQSKVEYNALIKKAREFEVDGDFQQSLQFYERAHEINCEDEKLQKKITKMKTLSALRRQSMLQQQQSIESKAQHSVQEGWEFDSANEVYVLQEHNDFYLTCTAYETLLPYQREGVAWLCGLHFRAAGGILGDDMGLGKTCQTITFINAAFTCSLVKRVLIVAPVSVLNVWSTEFTKFGPEITSRVHTFYGSNVRERDRNLDHVTVHGGVCLTSYGLCANNAERLSDAKWDYL